MDARLEPYRVVVSFLGEALGPDYEVVLHDLTSEDGTIVAIVNNHISGRTEGAPLSNMALRFIQERMYEKQDYLAGYQGASQAKGRLRSSTMFIKDGSELIGMLCINFDAAKYSRMAQELLSLCGAHQEPGPSVGVENFVSSLPDAVQAAITDVTGTAGLPPDRLTMDEKIRIVDDLQQAGDEMSADGITPLYFSLAGKAAGVIGVSDVVKESSAAAIAQMQTLGLQVVMLTGDNAATARHIGAAVGLDADHVIAGVLPAGKEAEVRALQKQGRVAMVGDGINDAPALTRAETGIAIGAGADVALDAADVVLVRSDLADVPAAVRLSRAVVRNIHQNLFWAFFYNAICIPLAAGVFTGFGITLNPMIASAAMSLSSVCVVTNALRLNTFDPRSAAHDAPPKRRAPVRASAPEIPCPIGSCPVQPAPENKTTQTEGTAMKKTIHIEGMMCGHCEATVKKALEALDGVQSAEVSHEKGTAVVSLTHDVADADLKTAVEARDYTVTGIDA